jgi:hypothetical protein
MRNIVTILIIALLSVKLPAKVEKPALQNAEME